MLKITIPAKHYLGKRKSEPGQMSLGFLTPYGTDAAAKKRMCTVDEWVNQYRGPHPKSEVLENMPLKGFQVTGSLRYGSHGNQDKWRVVDPRGFELEISSENLADLLECCDIQSGQVVQACVWARMGSQNYLLPVHHSLYEEAKKLTEIKHKKIKWQQVNLGDQVTLQNGISGVYLGAQHVLYKDWHDASQEKHNLLRTADPLHVIWSACTPSHTESQLHLIKGVAPSEAVPGSVLSPSQAEHLANQCLQDDHCDLRVPQNIRFPRVLCFSLSEFDLGSVQINLTHHEHCTDKEFWSQGFQYTSFVLMPDQSLWQVQSRSNAGLHCVPVRQGLFQVGAWDYVTEKLPRTPINNPRGWITMQKIINKHAAIKSLHHVQMEITNEAKRKFKFML